MVYVSSLLASMSDSQRRDYYSNCAKEALSHYDLGAYSTHFVQHNAGIVFRLDDPQGEPRFLLKIHESAGDGLMDPPDQLAAQMAWLQALANDGRLRVQSPITKILDSTSIKKPAQDHFSPFCQVFIIQYTVTQCESTASNRVRTPANPKHALRKGRSTYV
ncbi:MAG: hypothetical protein R2867_29565 [Caldilineaceae bacterium]